MEFYIKTDRNESAEPIGQEDGRNVLKRLRHQGRRLVEIFVLHPDGTIDCFQERTRRRLGSNAIASRTWLCETAQGDEWSDGRYIQEPLEAIEELDPEPKAVILVLQGAEAPELVMEQLQGFVTAG